MRLVALNVRHKVESSRSHGRSLVLFVAVVAMSVTIATNLAGLVPDTDRAESAYISQQVGPWLRTEALQAQSANIDIISGATYTSESYAQSLESALQQAHFG